MSTQNQEELVNSLFGIAPRVLAEQLTLRDVGFLKPLQLSEFEGSQGQVAWMKPNKLEISPNIIKAITYTNSVSFWVVSEVLNQKDVVVRAATIEYFISLLQELYNLNSFNVFAAVVHGLRHGSVDRLKVTWKTVAPKSLESWAALNPFIDQNAVFTLYDTRVLELSGKPYVPFLGVTLHVIHNMERGTKDTKHKRQRVAATAQATLDAISTASKHFEATVQPVEDIQSYLRDVPILSANAVYERSLEVEPRKLDEDADDNDVTDLKASSDSLTSSPLFFWGVPALAVAAIAATAFILYKRQH